MTDYKNPRPSPTTSAASPDALYDNSVTFEKLLNDPENQTTYRGKELISWQNALNLFGFGVASFDFATGGTLDSKNQLIRHSDELLYRYIGAGSFPLVVAPATNPVGNPDWEAFTATYLQALSGLDQPSDLDQSYRRAATVAQVENGDFPAGSRLRLTDRADAPFDVDVGGTPNGMDLLDAGGGNTAVYQYSDDIDVKHLGAALDYNTNIDDTPIFARAMELANPTPELTHSLSESRTVTFYGRPLINGQIVMREGVTLKGMHYGSVIMCGWSTSVWDKIVAYQKISGSATKNFALVNFQIAPNYGEDGSAITSPARLIYLDNVIEPLIDDVRCIQHLQATSQPTAINLPITGLETRRCSNLDMPSITFDGGQYGWYAGYAGTGGGSLNGRVGRVFSFNQQEIGVFFGEKTYGNTVDQLEVFVESNQGGSRIGVRLDSPTCNNNTFTYVKFGGDNLSASLQIQNGASFNNITGAAISTAPASIGGVNNRLAGFYSGSISNVGSGNEFLDAATPLPSGTETVFRTKLETKQNGKHTKALAKTLVPSDVDLWVKVASFNLENDSLSSVKLKIGAMFGGTPRVAERYIIAHRSGAAAVTYTEDVGRLYQLNSVDRLDIRVVAGAVVGGSDIEISRRSLMGATGDVDATVNIELCYDNYSDSLSYSGLI